MENFFKSHKPLSLVIGVIIFGLIAITALTNFDNAETFESLLILLASFTVTYTVFWLQTDKIWRQMLLLIVASLATFGFTYFLAQELTITILSGIIAAGLTEISFEVVFGFIADNIRNETRELVAEQVSQETRELVTLEANKWFENYLQQPNAPKGAEVNKTAPAQPAPAQSAFSQNKLIVWLVGLVYTAITGENDSENDAEVKRIFALTLIEAAMDVFSLHIVKKQPQGGVRKILTGTLKAGYSAWLKTITTIVSDEEEAHLTINDGKDVIFLAVKPNELSKPTPVVSDALAAETEAAKKQESKKPNNNGARPVGKAKGFQ